MWVPSPPGLAGAGVGGEALLPWAGDQAADPSPPLEGCPLLVLPLGPPSVPRKRRAGEGGRPLRPHAGPSGRGAQGLGGRSCLTNCAGSTDALPGVEPERDRLPDSWKVALSTHDRRDGGGPRCGRAGFRRVLFSSPWALTPRPLSFQPSRPLTSCSRPSCPSCPTPTAGSTGAAGSPT